jgi:FAD/FMN-containing dehydrogenase
MSVVPRFSTTAFDHLVGDVTGYVLRPDDPGYDAARRVHNGMIDRHPALIVRCRTAADAAAAVRFARAEGLDLTVRGGGHNVAGRAVADDAVMIDLAEMKGVAVDPAARTVRAEGGVLWAELNSAAGEHGLAVTGGAVSTTGIAGLTLGGGLGWLMGRHGLAADNLIEVELVRADGSIVTVDAASDPDLFWALRGGGGNFGIATSLTYRLHPLSTVTGGLVAHPFEAARDLFRFYRENLADCPDDLEVFAALVLAPDGSGTKLAALIICHAGDPEQARRDIAPFLEWGSPIDVQVDRIPYPAMNALLDEGFPAGALNYWVSSFTEGLPDAAIDIAVERFASVPGELSALVLEQFHGAVTRVGPTDTAVPHREPGWNLVLQSIWLDPAETGANIAWARETHAALRHHLTDRRWVNYLGDEGADSVRAAYGENWDRLVEVKRRVDPDNVFHHNLNIPPD